MADDLIGSTRVPRATYRLQFNAAFRFADAQGIAGYLHRLGISDVYASSYLKAVPGSSHGYDLADPTRLNPEIGSDEEYWAWIAELHSLGMGQLLDVVPNHMGIAGSSNPWWIDVLENGPSSRFARFFDIEWHPVKDELENKVLIPFLGDLYGAALERQELRLAYADGAFRVCYYDDWLPIAPDTFGTILGDGLDVWLLERTNDLNSEDVDELRSILTAVEHLPPRADTHPEQVAVRAREKEVVKRRLAALLGRNDQLRQFVDGVLTRFNGVRGDPRSFDRLDRLLNLQSYRIAHWRVASEEINYRRFFDVNHLAALRMEDIDVFDEVHRFVFELVGRGAATGFRIDHVDGLFSPADYLRRLQARAAEAAGAQGALDRPFYVVVEKVLGPDEQLPADWQVHGTTGYEFAAMINSLFVNARHESAFDHLYRRIAPTASGTNAFDDLIYRCKKQILHETMSGDINSLGHQLNRFSERNRHFRDFTLYSLISAIKEVIACFGVYRTYVTGDHAPSDHDVLSIRRAVRSARRRATAIPALVFDFIERLLLVAAGGSTADELEQRGRFVGKFQQITGPVAAKGIEDTALYVYNRLLSLNEVGSDPTRFGLPPARVHEWLEDRRRHWSGALSTTSTHDTKRGEDVRARLNVLSELPDVWKKAVMRWRVLNRRLKLEVSGVLAPDANEEYLLYQTLLGVWPFAGGRTPEFQQRVKSYMLKALREAKVNTSWLSPVTDYEDAVMTFIDRILDPRRPFLAAFEPLQSRIAALGVFNSLAQVLVKVTAPGVPDFYQGSELWDLSLVDPDNRRPVDYEYRTAMLERIAPGGEVDCTAASSLLEQVGEGTIKMFTTTAALTTRSRFREVFEDGSYVPLAVQGDKRDHVFAFARIHDGTMAITCVPRLVAGLTGGEARAPLGREIWGDTRIVAPVPVSGRCRDVFTGRDICSRGENGELSLDAAEVFDRFPVALLVTDERTRNLAIGPHG